MSAERLHDLAARLDELDDVPVDAHPDVLEELHRALVEDLESLALGRHEGSDTVARPAEPS